MVVENKRLEKTCCFYVSEFHLEMILLPYINEKIEEEITVLTEKDLTETLGILISKMNLKEENKQKIIELGWKKENKIKEKSNIIVVGSKKYIIEKNKEIEEFNPLTVLDCYNFEEEKDNINLIVEKYNNTLNTLGKNKFCKF